MLAGFGLMPRMPSWMDRERETRVQSRKAEHFRTPRAVINDNQHGSQTCLPALGSQASKHHCSII